MTDVLDAAALVALVRREPGAPEVREILRQGQAAVTAVNFAEANDALGRRSEIPAVDLERTLGAGEHGAYAVIPTDAPAAWRAATLRRRHYHRRDRPLSLADCHCLAAVGSGDRLVTSDRALLDAARDEGVAVVALPDSHGRRG